MKKDTETPNNPDKDIQKQNRKEEKEQKKRQRKEKYSLTGKDIVNTAVEILTGKKVITKENEFIKDYYTMKNSSVAKHSPYSKKEKVVFEILAATILNTLLLIIRYVYAYTHLSKIIVSNNAIYLVAAAIIPFVTWVISTDTNFWAFHKRKRLFFYLCTINALLVLFQPVYTIIRNFVVPLASKIPVNPCLTPKMVVFLVHILILALIILSLFMIYRQLEIIIMSETTRRQIELFKLQHIRDDRESRQYKYDITTIKSRETGKPIRIKENDRFVQAEMAGPSGTGKTSTIFLNVILQDLIQKVKNREKRHEEIMLMLTQKKATIQGPLREFDENAVIPIGKTKKEYEKNKKQLEKIKKKYPDCGMTIVAPNAALNEDIIRMCAARDIKVNALDPVNTYGEYENVIEVKINPFYIPFGLDERERANRITKAASVFSDVLIATNQMGGQSDVYFTDISLSVSSNIASVVMLAKNIQGEQAFIDDIHECIGNFDNLIPYVEIIEKHFGIRVETSSNAAPRGAGKITADFMSDIQNQPTSAADRRKARKNPYYQQLLFVKQELLENGKEAMFSQARGLRNLINKILQDDHIKTKLSAQDDTRLDFDEILSKNQITVVNTGIELGQSTSTSFGLFFLLLHKNSVLRRPKTTRSPHFLWIDECAQYVHPFFDDVIALYRQYRVAAVLTLQTLTQLEKNKATAYLKNVFLGAGTHIVFGRMATEEMKLFSEMAGIVREEQEQKTYSTNSVLSSNPNYNESVRTTPVITNNMEGADLRMLDFLELTIFTVDNGRVLPGQFARVFFIGPDAFDEQKTKVFLWEKAVPEAFEEIPEKEDTKRDYSAEPDEEDEYTPVEFADEILSDAQEELLIEATPAADRIEEEQKKEMSLNDIYKMLIEN